MIRRQQVIEDKGLRKIWMGRKQELVEGKYLEKYGWVEYWIYQRTQRCTYVQGVDG
jgi:hypothetical protein